MKFFLTCLLVFGFFFAQSQETKPDTFSLKRIFTKGNLKGSIRQFSMFTNNSEGLTDYYALAIGGGLNYQSRRWKNFQITFGGFFVHDLGSSDFSKIDPVTNTISRYDAGLFDVLELNNSLISRVEKLNIEYFFKKSSLTFGKQIIKSPFVNPQDGRMTSSMMEGIYGDFNPTKKLHLEGGWLYRSSPRSTFEWFKIGNSIGTYPMGVSVDGKKSNYLSNVDSKGLLIVGGNYAFLKNTKLTAWNYLIENVSNTSFFQWNHTLPRRKIYYGLQLISQKALNFGGNTDQIKTYMAAGSKSLVLGSSLGLIWGKNNFNINYSRITEKGRFQFPREWGRDPLFTFLQRERNEGLGDVHAFTSNFSKSLANKKLQLDIGAGKYVLPDVKNSRLNKYGMPSYSQLNVGIKYSPKGMWDGLDFQVLFVKKWNNGELYNDEKYRINKVDMSNTNVILNYSF
jgi:hypothetical protein